MQFPIGLSSSEMNLYGTYTMVDKVGDVAMGSRIYSVNIFHIVQVKKVGGSLSVVQVTPPLSLI